MNKYDLGKGMTANSDQKIAIDKMYRFMESDAEEFTLIGKAGTGKTTIVKKAVDHFNNISGSMFGSKAVAATISHAAKNILSKAIGDSLPSTVTVAKLLGMKQEIDENGEIEFIVSPISSFDKYTPPIETAKLIVVDECSMISKHILSLIRENKLPEAKVLYMGDWHQLPPIDKHREKNEDSETFSIEHQAVLNQRMRQKEDNPIIALSDVFADSIDTLLEGKDFDPRPLKLHHRKDNYNPITKEGVKFPTSLRNMFADIISDFKVAQETGNANHVKLIAYRKRNRYGNAPYNISSLNATVRKRLWDTSEQFVVGEILIANEAYAPMGDVFFQNGDSLVVTKISHDIVAEIDCCLLTLQDTKGEVMHRIPVVSYKGKKDYQKKIQQLIKEARKDRNLWKKFYRFKETFANISYGYAVTSHKAQGSGFDNVYVFEDDIMGVRTTTFKEKQQCMYTAITRSIQKCTIYSQLNGR